MDQEEDYLAELMAEFRVDGAPPVSSALYLVQERYRMLWSHLLSRDLQRFASSYARSDADGQAEFVAEAEGLIKDIHEFLFEGVLSNAGEYRSASDAHSGVVWFGGQDRYYRQVGRFQGSAPSDISEDVRSALAAYAHGLRDPLHAVCTFYQRFVRTHPFYDANGRIARLIAALLLRWHGLEVRWSEMENRNNEFIRRLNYVHKHNTYPQFYLAILTSYVDKFTDHILPTADAVDQ